MVTYNSSIHGADRSRPFFSYLKQWKTTQPRRSKPNPQKSPDRIVIDPLPCDPTGEKTVAAEICGDSLVTEGIYHGDLAICWLNPVAPVGALVLFDTPRGLVVKRLRPGLDESFRFIGVVKKVIHRSH